MHPALRYFLPIRRPPPVPLILRGPYSRDYISPEHRLLLLARKANSPQAAQRLLTPVDPADKLALEGDPPRLNLGYKFLMLIWRMVGNARANRFRRLKPTVSVSYEYRDSDLYN